MNQRRVRVMAVVIALAFGFTQPAIASLTGTIDYTNDRAVPLMTSTSDLNSNGSGFLYSPRIVFTSAHTAFEFRNGERIDFRQFLAVGKPNTNIKTIGQGVKVIKRISASGYLPNKDPDLNDFAILILEEDLAQVEPAQLLTPDIQKELVESRADVKLHGFGNIQDLCALGESLPCSTNRPQTSEVPRSLTAKLHPYEDFPNLVGYEVPQRLRDQLLFFTAGKASMCGGDSGGSLTTTYNSKILYLANIGTAERIYACGQSRIFDGKGGINYSQPIYKYLDLIKEAEEFVSQQKASEKVAAELKAKQEAEAKAAAELKAKQEAEAKAAAVAKAAATKKTTITCVKGKLTKKVTAVKPVCPKGYKKK